MRDYVYYFSKNDLTLGQYLEMAEKRIQEIPLDFVPSSTSDAIELWHIHRMLDDGCQLAIWSEEHLLKLKTQTDRYHTIVAKFFNGLKQEDIMKEFDALEWPYKKTFFQIIDEFHMYQIISPESLREIIVSNVNHLRSVLSRKQLVDRFKTVIREVLMSNAHAAYLLLEAYVSKRSYNDDTEIYFPPNLTLEDKEQIILNYLNSKAPNINYVRLITQIKDDKSNFSLSPKTKLIAERLAQKLNDELIEDPRTVTIHWNIGVQFIDDETLYPRETWINEEGMPTYIYSIPYITKCNCLQRVYNCVSLFEWMNNTFLINLINKRTEVETIEPFLVDKGRYSYPSYGKFDQKNKIAVYQLFGYCNVLNKNERSLENDLKFFYENHLKSDYGYTGLSINLPSENDSYLSKCRILCPELDAVVKQYSLYVEDGIVDKDLIRLSKPCKVEEGKSLLNGKYYAIAKENQEIWAILRCLFGSGNAMLQCVDPHKKKHYRSFIELLEKEEDVQYSNYSNYQKPHIDFLLKHGLIGINAKGNLYIMSAAKISLLKNLWEYDVCSYWQYNEEDRRVLDDMLEKGWLVKDNHLLSEPERDYFSFYLDNQKFTNGTAYRNHYMHGSSAPSEDENEHANAYWTILRLFTILLLKIEGDLWLAQLMKK